MTTDRRRFLASSLGTLGSFAARANAGVQTMGEAKARAQIASFVADVTPFLGQSMDTGLSPPVSTIEHPLMAKA
jgi:hypothetical protein